MIPRTNRADTLCSYPHTNTSLPVKRLLVLLSLLLAANTPLWAQQSTTDEPGACFINALFIFKLWITCAAVPQVFNAKAKLLEQYPLRPYLDYHRVNGRLNNASAKEINGFMSEHGDLAPSDLLYRRWLKTREEAPLDNIVEKFFRRRLPTK